MVYAGTNIPNEDVGHRWVAMHRMILGEPEDQGIDHKNGNGLDNRRCNLRLSGQSGNTANASKGSFSSARRKTLIYSSQFRGVSRAASKINPWRVLVEKDGVRRFSQNFPTEIEAAIAYDRAASEVHGEFARLNFPDGEPAVPPAPPPPIRSLICCECGGKFVQIATRSAGRVRRFCFECRPQKMSGHHPDYQDAAARALG